MEYTHPLFIVCPDCGKKHIPHRKRGEWDWNRFYKCQGCGIVLFAGWDDVKEHYYCEILEGENPYDESVLVAQAKHDQMVAERKEQARLEVLKQRERIKQARLGIKPFQSIKGGLVDNDHHRNHTGR